MSVKALPLSALATEHPFSVSFKSPAHQSKDMEIKKDEMHAISLKCTEFYLCQFQKCHRENDLET